MNVEEVVASIKAAILDTHEVKLVKNEHNYKGIDLTHYKFLAGAYTIAETIDDEGYQYFNERGEDMLDLLIRKTFQLGFEQGMISEKVF